MIVYFILPLPVFANNEVTASFTVPLLISKISASSVNTQSATISWETNSDATSQIFYDTQFHENIAAYRYAYPIDPTLVTQHSLQINPLSPFTTYHYRAKSVATVGGTEFVAISGDYTFQTTGEPAQGGSGGGGAGDGTDMGSVAELTDSTTLMLNSVGVVQNSIQLTSSDDRVSLEIPAGTVLNVLGQTSYLLSVSIPTSVLPPSQNAIIIVYDFSPAGVTFAPPIMLTMRYDRATLPAGVSENTLFIAYWDGSQWQALQSMVDTQTGTISALTSHFTLFALIGIKPTPAEIPPSLPTTPLVTPTPTPNPIPTRIMPTTAVPAITPISTPTWFASWGLISIGIIGILSLFVFALGLSLHLRKREKAAGIAIRLTIQPVASKIIFIAGILNVNIAKRLVTTDGIEVQLTTKEYRLLETLVKHAGTVRTYQQLLKTVWGQGYKKELQLLHTTIRNLRSKIELDPTHPIHIITTPGVGYFLKTT